MGKGIDVGKALEMLLSPYPRQGATVLGIIDAAFEKVLPGEAIPSPELDNLFSFEKWASKLPSSLHPIHPSAPAKAQAVEAPAPSFTPARPSLSDVITPRTPANVPAPAPARPSLVDLIPAAAPGPERPSPTTFAQVSAPAKSLAPTPAPAPAPLPVAPAPPVARPPALAPTPAPESKPRTLADILGSFMKSETGKAVSLPSALDESETEPASGLSAERTSAILDRLRQQKANLASVAARHAEEESEVKHAPVAPQPRPAVKLGSSQALAFNNPREWFEIKSRRTYMFTKFAFRLTPDEKKIKEQLVGTSAFAPNNFILRSAVLEVKVRKQMDEDAAIGIFWDWLKRDIIAEEKQVGEGDEL